MKEMKGTAFKNYPTESFVFISNLEKISKIDEKLFH